VEAASHRDMRPAYPALVGEFKNAFGPRIEGTMDRVTESRRPSAAALDTSKEIVSNGICVLSFRHAHHRFGQKLGAQLGCTEQHGPAAENA